MAIIAPADINLNKVDLFRSHLSDVAKHHPNSTFMDLLAYVAGMDPDNDEPADILAWFAENQDSDEEEKGFSRSTKIEALFSLKLQTMAGAVEASDKDAAAIEKKLYTLLGNGDFWSRAKLIESAKPDFNKDNPQDDANMDAAFAKLTKRGDVHKVDKDKNLSEGRGRWSFLVRKSADTGK